jgi:hypothetical protein
MNTSPIVASFVYNDVVVYDNTDEEVIKNVQGCDDKILGAYENYELELSQNEFISYFDFLGEVEKKHECAGFCAQEDVYYFYNIQQTHPIKSCDDAMK